MKPQLKTTAIDCTGHLHPAAADAGGAAEDTRARIARDLHDGTQAHLVHTIITLKLAQRAHRRHDDAATTRLIADALEEAERANRELRDLVRGIGPSALRSGGLRAAIEQLVPLLSADVDLHVTTERLPAAVEMTAYFVIAEALTNVAKHSGAQRAVISARVQNKTLHIEVSDNGVGGAQPESNGLRGVAARVHALQGRLLIDSPTGRGTRIHGTLPL